MSSPAAPILLLAAFAVAIALGRPRRRGDGAPPAAARPPLADAPASAKGSPLARSVDRPRRDLVARTRPIFGFALHTTGTPLAASLRYYQTPGAYSSTYVVDLDGTIYQVADDRLRTLHVGRITERGTDRRTQYLTAGWVDVTQLADPPKGVSQAQWDRTVARWRQAWPGYASPYHLFPDPSPNDSYLGVEMIPVDDPAKTPPIRAGMRFTAAQHEMVARLLAERGATHGLPSGWWDGPRLVGHEDVGLLDRSDAGGGWDPGWLRDQPYVDLPLIRARVAELSGAPMSVA